MKAQGLKEIQDWIAAVKRDVVKAIAEKYNIDAEEFSRCFDLEGFAHRYKELDK